MSTEAFHEAMTERARLNDAIAAHIEACETASDRPSYGDQETLLVLWQARTFAENEAIRLAGFHPCNP